MTNRALFEANQSGKRKKDDKTNQKFPAIHREIRAKKKSNKKSLSFSGSNEEKSKFVSFFYGKKKLEIK
jgi:hypothetical protein